ncbi:MAG: filamentous hemagglutinin N-terminal domain-containing protein, partial [Cyanobacteria bacterium P01_F01_bin.143]
EMMKKKPSTYLLNFGLFLNLVMAQVATAQVISDQSLPDNSIVDSEGNIIKIDGGTTRENNLFHSFEQFSVPNQTTVSFQNTEAIQNIFSRVTGDSISNIEGILEAQGAANLFLMNPNGIIFGENASLNIGGSFLATTAETILFNDQTEFSTNLTDTSPLLTITAPVGLDLGTNPGNIINRATLAVPLNNTLAFLGGEIILDGSTVSADEGRIELGAIASNNLVSLSSDDIGWKLDYKNVENFQNIELDSSIVRSGGDRGGELTLRGKDLILSGDSRVVTRGNFGGNIELQGENITLEGGSQVLFFPIGMETGNLKIEGSESVTIRGSNGFNISSVNNAVMNNATGEGKTLSITTKNLIISDGGQVSTRTRSSGRGADLIIDASESITVEGAVTINDGRTFSSGLFAGVAQDATGDGGRLSITTQQLAVKGGGQISNSTIGQGDGGNIDIFTESILLEGRDLSRDSDNASGIFSQVVSTDLGNSGNAGNIKIETKDLSILEGAAISTTARDTGNGGNITINSSNSIILSGSSNLGDIGSSFSGIFVIAETDADGNAGSIDLETKQLLIEKSAIITASNLGTGLGGKVDIQAESLILREGGRLGAGSFASGSGGIVIINATESVEVTGEVLIRDELLINSSIFTNATETGEAGNLDIITPRLTVSEEGNINVSATGTGGAGRLTINAQDITLDNGSLTAATRSGDQGGITLNNADTLLLRNSSEITTNAQEEATGGDIIINSDAIALIENSDITANAIEGRGGNIRINTQGIFQDSDSEITAASERGIDGEIVFNTPDVDPTSGVFQLPDIPLDAEGIIAQNLCKVEDEKIAKGSSFLITGKGGVTPTSEDSLDNVDRVVSWSNRDDIQVSQDGSVGVRTRYASETAQHNYPVIQQSQGWVQTADGNLWLVAHAPETNSQNSGIDHPNCRSSP